MVPNKSQFCSQVPNFISKDVEKSRFRSRSRDFCQIFEGFGFGSGQFGLGKKVSVSVSENLVSGKKSRFRKIWYRKTSLGIDFGQNFCIVIQWWFGDIVGAWDQKKVTKVQIYVIFAVLLSEDGGPEPISRTGLQRRRCSCCCLRVCSPRTVDRFLFPFSATHCNWSRPSTNLREQAS